MREIKFRAWHSKKKKWLHTKADACHILGESILLGAWCRVPIQELKHVVVEQFTGLLDHKGVEVFEGDLVALAPKVKYYRRVTFHAGQYWLVNGSSAWEIGCMREHSSHPKAIVVGNIHDNPGLLKEKP
jgi:uncharacterized phage protein (TIGR01671 family)